MLASRFGWSYETLMSMTGAERRLWLAAADRIGPRNGPEPRDVHAAATHAAVVPAEAPGVPGRLTTEAERRARLLELSEQYAARYRR